MNIIIETAARAAHEVNRAYCLALGDTSQQPWEQAPDWQKDSARNGVSVVLGGATPEQSHESWFREKQSTGWKYGSVKDVEKKEHPCMLAYDALPEEQKAKDTLYIRVVQAVADSLRKEDPNASKYMRL